MELVDSMDKEIDNLLKAPYFGDTIYKWEGFWHHRPVIKGAISFRSNFKALDDDVILASTLKTGTTWLKSLCTSIMECKTPDEEDSLAKKNPHHCILNLEIQVFVANSNPNPDLSGIPSPRFFQTHLAYSVLPDSIKKSKCKIVYITRNPKDMLVSLWHFFNKCSNVKQGDHLYPFGETFEAFCQDDVYISGPFYDHVLEYWNESLKMPERILFLRYEELKRDHRGQVKRLADFLEKPLEDDEVEEVLRRSSLERLKSLEVNKDGLGSALKSLEVNKDGLVSASFPVVPNSAFFRVGAIGGWKDYITPEMERRIDEITRMKLQGSGLHLDP